MRPLLLLALTLISLPAQARPISYPDGWMAMFMNDVDMNAFELDYTITPHHAVGWRHEYDRDTKSHMDAGQWNYLVKRWNNPGSQANIFLQSGIGVAYESDNAEPAAYTGISADWESRRYFVMYQNHAMWAGDINDFVKHTARVGITPYIGDYGDIHTWLMLQADYDAGKDDTFSLTPLVRLFSGST